MLSNTLIPENKLSSAVSPTEQLDALGLLTPQINLHSISAAQLDAFSRRQVGFDWLHLGQTSVTIGQLSKHLLSLAHIQPPRTGHLGNWGGILRNDAGAMDFNHPTTRGGLGRGLIYTFNQTETSDLSSGDVVYRPATDFSSGQAKPLPLFSWQNGEFRPCDPSVAYFSPMIQTLNQGQRQSLVSFHMAQLPTNLRFQSESDLIYRQWPLVLSIIKHLLRTSLDAQNPKAECQELISHVVSLDGQVARAGVAINQVNGLRTLCIEGLEGLSLDELAERCVLPFMASSDPETFFNHMKSLPERFPVVSNTLTRILSALCHSHFDTESINQQMMTPFNPHYHWGARAMAGYPPIKRGYFSNKNKRRFTSRFCQRIIEVFPEVAPLLFLILPSSVFMLQASTRHPEDASCLDRLFDAVMDQTEGQASQPELMVETVSRLVGQWLDKEEGKISLYLLNRFRPNQGVEHGLDEMADCSASLPIYEPLDSDSFHALGLQQACMIVGCLHQQLAT